MCFCVGSGIAARDGVGWLWGCFGPPGGLLCWPFWGGGPGVGLALALCCFVVCSAGRFVVCLSLCRFVLVFFGPFGVAVASLGGWGGVGGGAGLGAFRAFVRFVLVWVCRFPLPLGVGGGGGGVVLRFVIVALPGLSSSLFYFLLYIIWQKIAPLAQHIYTSAVFSCAKVFIALMCHSYVISFIIY